MNTSPVAKVWSNGFTYLYLLYNYVDNRQKKLSIDVLVMCLEETDFNAKMNSSGTEILLSTKMPSFFTSKNCIRMADGSLTANMSKVVASQDAADKFAKDNNHETDIWGPPQRIKLPFKCDTIIPVEHKTDGFESWTIQEMTDESMGERYRKQCHMVLSVGLEGIDKPRKVSSAKEKE